MSEVPGPDGAARSLWPRLARLFPYFRGAGWAMPAERALRRSSSRTLAEHATTGSPGTLDLISRVASKPSITGIKMSMSTRSKQCSVANLRY